MKLDPAGLSPATLHSLMDRIVTPRPAVLISTLGAEGVPHLASVSWYSTANAFPPVQYFSVMHDIDDPARAVLADIRSRGDFVINSVDEALGARLISMMSGGQAPEADWFKTMDLTALPSVKVAAPRIGESPAHMECRLVDLLELGNGAVTVVFGAVVQFHVRDGILASGRVDFEQIRLLGQLAGGSFTTTHEIYELPVPDVASFVPPSG